MKEVIVSPNDVQAISEDLTTLNGKIAKETVGLTNSADAQLTKTQAFISNGIVTITGTSLCNRSGGFTNATLFTIESGKRPKSNTTPACSACAFNDSGTPVAYGFGYIDDNGQFIVYFSTNVAYHYYIRFCITYSID